MKLNESLKCFKKYDVRGKLGVELDEGVAYRIGRATAQSLATKSVVLGFDARESSPKLAAATAKGICDAGSNTLKIGLVGTEEVYSAVSTLKADAGIEITASHNPIEYNGMKIVNHGPKPLTEKEFSNIKEVVELNDFKSPKTMGLSLDKQDEAKLSYLDKIISFVDLNILKSLKIVINSGNGAAGLVVDALKEAFLEKSVPVDFVLVNNNPDPSFPKGIPNPALKKNQSETAHIIKSVGADFGVAFDGDFDRCFFFDHLGNFIPGEYMVGLLSTIFLTKQTGSTVVHDPRVIWNIQDVVKNMNGRSHITRTGHAFFKSAMREVNAVYGGEMSAHHYFRDFSYCDSGMIPWLLIWELISQKNVSLADLVAERKRLFPSSGEINFRVSDPSQCVAMVKSFFIDQIKSFDEIDGISMSFEKWRFNLRKSNTEPLVRLNVETVADEQLLKRKTEELESIIIKT